MVNEDILWGLKSALERGQSLKSAMLSFYNAGYKREEIEEAARSLVEPVSMSSQPEPVSSAPPVPPTTYSEPQTEKPAPRVFKKLIPDEKQNVPIAPTPSSSNLKPEKTSKPKMSNYEDKASKKKSMIILLICALVFLLGILTLLLVFRQDLINFFSSIFS